MSFKRHIPNTITAFNILCGTLSIIAVFHWNLQIAAYFIFAGAVFDFFDGFVARLLKVSGAFGKELDSLCDVVTFGVAPGMIVYKMLFDNFGAVSWVPFLALLIPVFSALRLAKFNLDERQTTGFIGLPTPANALFFAGISFINAPFFLSLLSWQWLLPILTILFSFLLIAEVPLMSLKFKNFRFKENIIRYIFLFCALLLIIVFTNNALPSIILIYILISLISNFIKK
ncbi:MAG: CDP-diacylglycerol--serine O-phosphatidyltransferase [Bacteroidales bacterium]|jgi:CDP-diacylglycerol--serine O-phosphatidyltransferase|nr:CDP-diacylglycerol--serine O-phosphatidyltransferase [Bacteroidales bacterium]